MKNLYLVMVVTLTCCGNVVDADPYSEAASLSFEWVAVPALPAERPAFDSDLAQVSSVAAAARAAQETVELLRDKLTYYRVQVTTGALEEGALWPHAQALTEAKQTEASATAEYKFLLTATAQRWGNERWWEMRDLIVVITSGSTIVFP